MRCDRVSVERDRWKLDTRDDTARMLEGQREPDLELRTTHELPRDAQRAIRFVVRIVRGGAVRLDVCGCAPSLVRVRERRNGHEVELRQREHRERNPEPARALCRL